jgi:hypothetical protein
VSVRRDGGGVVPDVDLPEHGRITFLLPGAEDAVTAWVEDDVLHIAGQYRGLHLGRVAFNHVTVRTYGLGKDRTP